MRGARLWVSRESVVLSVVVPTADSVPVPRVHTGFRGKYRVTLTKITDRTDNANTLSTTSAPAAIGLLDLVADSEHRDAHGLVRHIQSAADRDVPGCPSGRGVRLRNLAGRMPTGASPAAEWEKRRFVGYQLDRKHR